MQTVYLMGPVTNLLSVLCILIEILSHTHAKGWEGGTLNNFKFGTFISRFQSDGVGSMAVKGLKQITVKGYNHSFRITHATRTK